MKINSRHLHLLRSAFSVSVIALTVYFITKALLANWDKVKAVGFEINIYSLLALVFFVLAVLVSGLLWGGILERLSGQLVKKSDAIRVHIGSWLLKYIPGQVGSFTGKLTWGIKHGYSKKSVTVSFIYENILLIVTSTLVALPVLAFIFLDRINSNLSLFLPVLVVIPLTLVAFKPVFYRLLNLLLKLAKKPPIPQEFFLKVGELAVYHAKFLLPRLLNGVGFILIAMTVTPVEPSMYLVLAATYVLAGIIGILVLFVPSGLGVREAVIILFLSAYFPMETAALIAIIARFYATAADAILGVIYYAIGRLKGSKV